MKHVLKLSNFKTLWLIGSLFAITLPLVDGCKTTHKTTSNNSTNTTKGGAFSDTAALSKTDTGKQTSGGKDKPPRR